MPSHHDLSRTNWMRPDDTFPGVEVVKSGCLQRIADATELMAKSHQELIDDRDRYKRYYEDYLAGYEAQIRSIRAYKAHNTRLRNQIAALKDEMLSETFRNTCGTCKQPIDLGETQ